MHMYIFCTSFCLIESGIILGVGGLCLRTGNINEGAFYIILGYLLGVLGGYVWGTSSKK